MKTRKIIFVSLVFGLIYSLNAYGINKNKKEDIISTKIDKNKSQETKKALPTVAIITTGGTIAEVRNPKTGGAIPAVSGQELIEAVPGLDKIARIKVTQFSNVDSSRITPEMWRNLSQKVDEILKDSEIKGAVVTHGTDTMAEGAYFLDLTLKTDKPVVFVGAMRDNSDLSPDGPANIYNAVLQAASDEAKNFGVTVTLNQYINSARYVRKTETTNVQTFTSGENGYLGYIAMGKVHKFHDRIKEIKIPLPKKLQKVVLLKTFAGDDGSFVKYAVDNGAKGIVVEGVGAGNVNQAVFKEIKYALSKKVIVVIATRVFNGAVYPIYGGDGGGKTLQSAGAILVGDLTGPKARILLMLAISSGSSVEEIKKYFEFI